MRINLIILHNFEKINILEKIIHIPIKLLLLTEDFEFEDIEVYLNHTVKCIMAKYEIYEIPDEEKILDIINKVQENPQMYKVG